jgi:hypothetical protein
MPHRRLAQRLSGINWLRWELGSVIGFHGAIGLLILLAPVQFVITPATWPVFFYIGRVGMAVLFLAVAAIAVTCWWRPRPLLQVGLWVLVYMLGAGWLTGFVLAIRQGSGGLYGVVVWSVLLVLWASTAVRLGLGDGGTGVAESRSRRSEQ